MRHCQTMLPFLADDRQLADVVRVAVETRAALVVDRIRPVDDESDGVDRPTDLPPITHAIAIECAGDSAGTLLLGGSLEFGQRLAELERGIGSSDPVDEEDAIEAIRALAMAIATTVQRASGVDRPLPFAIRVDTGAVPCDATTVTFDVEGEPLRVSWTPARALRQAA